MSLSDRFESGRTAHHFHIRCEAALDFIQTPARLASICSKAVKTFAIWTRL